jgi:hypothetical protein
LRWKICHRVTQVSTEGESHSNNSPTAKEFHEALGKIIDKHEYNEQQLYNCDKTALYNRMLPTKSLDFNNSVNKHNMKMTKDSVTLLFYTNKLGHHK